MLARKSWILLACMLATTAHAGGTANGGTESNLSLGATSRGIGLGGAFLASVDDASAVYWNPAKLASLERGSVILTHMPIGFGDATLSFAGVAYPTLGAGTFAFGFQHLSTDGIQAYDATSQALGSLEYSETALYAGYAHAIAAGTLGALQVGATAKTFTQSLTPWSSTGAGLDLGLACTPRRFPDLGLAFVWRDAIAPHVRLDQTSDAAPATLQFAGTWRTRATRTTTLALNAGVDHTGPLGWSPRLGLEAGYGSHLQLRLGSSRNGVAFGLGVTWQNAALDYAFLGHESAATQPVSVRTEWGMRLENRLAARTTAREAALRAQLQDRLEARLDAAQAAFDRGDYAAAVDEWKVVAGLDPADERAERGIQAAGAKLAETQARDLADREQVAAHTAQFELGLRYYGQSEYALARDVWAQLRQQDPANTEVQRYLDKNEKAFRDQLRAQSDEAHRLEIAGDWVDALAAWTRIRATDNQRADAEAALERCRMGLERQNARRWDASRGSNANVNAGTNAIAKAAPVSKAAAAPFRDAVAAYSSGEISRAVTLLREVRRLDPANQEAERLLAKAERQLLPLGDEDRARVREMYLRGMSFFTANQFDKAIEAWSKILDVDPGNTSVYQNIREARARLRALQP